MHILAVSGAEKYYSKSNLHEHFNGSEIAFCSPSLACRAYIEDDLQVEPDEAKDFENFPVNLRAFITEQAPKYWFNTFVRSLRFSINPGTPIIWIDDSLTIHQVDTLKFMQYEVTTIGIGDNIPLQVPDIIWPGPPPPEEFAVFIREHFGLTKNG